MVSRNPIRWLARCGPGMWLCPGLAHTPSAAPARPSDVAQEFLASGKLYSAGSGTVPGPAKALAWWFQLLPGVRL